jgi:protein-S-isoprenylcysteine O-methyltransferase Ste14
MPSHILLSASALLLGIPGMSMSSSRIINGLWLVFALYWLVSALKRKRTKERESFGHRLLYVIPLALTITILFRDNGGLRHTWMAVRFVPDTSAMQTLGVLLTAAGVFIAIWARYHLGANWSGTVTLKEGHELIRTGPYRSIRHPIYTGILIALLGTAIAIGEVRALIGVVIAWGSFYIKATREESLLVKEFGSNFVEHQHRTGMFLPRFS